LGAVDRFGKKGAQRALIPKPPVPREQKPPEIRSPAVLLMTASDSIGGIVGVTLQR
jgi:hypothetical protein